MARLELRNLHARVAEGGEKIFAIHTREMNLAEDVDFAELAADADDASGADIKAVCTEAGMFAIRDDRTEVEMADFDEAWAKIEADEETTGDATKSFA